MKNYINPEMKITKFYSELISTTATPLPTIDPLSVATMGSGVSDAIGGIDGAQQAVQGNVNFQKAIEFK